MTDGSADAAGDGLFEFSLHAPDVLKRFGWSFFSLAAIRGKGLLTLPLAIAILGASGYGEVTVALATASLLVPLVLLNVPDGAGLLVVGATSSALAYGRVRRIRRFGLAISVAGLAAGALAAALVGQLLVLWIGTLTASAALFKVATVHMQYFQQVARLARLSLVAEYGAVTVGLALAVPFGAGGMLVANSVIVAAVAAVAWRSLPAVSSPAAEPFWRPAMNLALPLLPGAFMQWALISVDSVLIFHYLGDGPTGAYSSAYSIASIAMLIPLALNSVWYATAQRLLARSVAALARFATGVGALVVFGGALLTAIAAAAGPLVTAKWLVEPVFRAVPECLPWLVVGFTLLALAKVAEGIVYAFGHPRLILAASVAAGAVNFGLNLLWIPAHGIVGAAWATAVGYGVLAGCLVLFAVATLARGGERRGAVAAG